MWSMWNAPSDRDYYEQFAYDEPDNPERECSDCGTVYRECARCRTLYCDCEPCDCTPALITGVSDE